MLDNNWHECYVLRRTRFVDSTKNLSTGLACVSLAQSRFTRRWGKAFMSVVLDDPQPPKEYLLGSDRNQPEGWPEGDEPENRGDTKKQRNLKTV